MHPKNERVAVELSLSLVLANCRHDGIAHTHGCDKGNKEPKIVFDDASLKMGAPGDSRSFSVLMNPTPPSLRQQPHLPKAPGVFGVCRSMGSACPPHGRAGSLRRCLKAPSSPNSPPLAPHANVATALRSSLVTVNPKPAHARAGRTMRPRRHRLRARLGAWCAPLPREGVYSREVLRT